MHRSQQFENSHAPVDVSLLKTHNQFPPNPLKMMLSADEQAWLHGPAQLIRPVARSYRFWSAYFHQKYVPSTPKKPVTKTIQ